MKKKIFRISSLLLAIACLASFAGCAEKKTENEISKLIADGYECVMSSGGENVWKGLYIKDGSYEKVYRVTATMSDAEFKAYDSISYDDENCDEKKNDILLKVKDVVSEDISASVPSEADFSKYEGKTIGELENDGYENTGYTGDEGIYSFFYDGPEYCLIVHPAEGTVISDMDDYSANDIRALTIGKVEFSCFSFGIIE